MQTPLSRRVLRPFALACAFACCWISGAFAQNDVVRIVTSSGELSFNVEIADEPDERARGLMHRQSMDRDAGMLFVYEQPQYASFWMKNTPLPLDILFADETGFIITIARETTPFSTRDIPSGGVILGVLEINAGLADELGVAEGDRLIHPAFKP